MSSEAQFTFGTNIQPVVDEIITQLSLLDARLAGAGTGERNQVASDLVAQLEKLPAKINAEGARIEAAYRNALKGGEIPPESLGTAFQTLATQIRTGGEQVVAAMSPLQRQLAGGTKTIRDTVAGSLEAEMVRLRTLQAELEGMLTKGSAPALRGLIDPSATGQALTYGSEQAERIRTTALPAFDPRFTEGVEKAAGSVEEIRAAFESAKRTIAEFTTNGIVDVARLKAEIAALNRTAAELNLARAPLDAKSPLAKQMSAQASEYTAKARALSTGLTENQAVGRASVVGDTGTVDLTSRITEVEALRTAGSREEAVALARVTRAELELTAVREAGLAGSSDELVRLEQLIAAEERLAGTTKRAAEATAVQGGTQEATAAKQGIGGAFAGGLFGRGYQAGQEFDQGHAAENLVGTVGVLARYGAAGVGIAAIFRTLSEVKTQFLDYQSALANFGDVADAVAVGQININQAVAAGIPAGEGGATAVNTAAEALARYREEIHTVADANRIATETVRDVGVAMVLTGQDAKTSAGQLFDATQGFGLGSGSQSRILDAVENSRRNFGGDRAQILQATSDAADLAASAGIDPEQLTNIVALIQARTGSSATSVASAFERTVSRSGTGQFQQALSGLGVQNTGDLIQEITQMSAKYKDLTTVQQQQLIAQLGGARQAKEILPLLQDGTQLLDANAKSYAGAGAAADYFAHQQNTLTGQLRQISGSLRDIALQFAQSGILLPFGVLIDGLRPLLAGVDDLLRLFNKIPGPARGVAAAIFEILLAVRLLKAEELGQILTSTIGRVPYAGAPVRGILGPVGNGGVDKEEKLSTEEKAAQIRLSTEEKASEIRIATEERAASIRLGEETLRPGGGVPVVPAGEKAPVVGGETVTTRAGATAEATAGRAETLGLGTAGADAAGLAIGEELAPAVTGAAAGFAAAGSGLLALATNPITIAIGGLIAIGEIKGSMDKLKTAASHGSEGLDQLANATTIEGFKTANSTLTSAAEEQKRAGSGFWGHITSALGHGPGGLYNPFRTDGPSQSEDKAGAQYAQDEAARLASEQAVNQGNLATQYFGATGTDVGAGVRAMSAAGFTPAQVIAGVSQATSAAAVNAATSRPTGLIYNEATLAGIVAAAQQTLGKDVDPKKLRKAAVDALARYGIQEGQVIPPRVRDAVIGALIATNYGPVDVDPATGKPSWDDTERDRSTNTLKGKLDSLQTAGAAGSGPLNNQDLTGILEDSADGKTKGLISQIDSFQPSPLDITGGEATYARAYQSLRRLADRTPESERQGVEYQKLIAEMDKTEAQYVQVRVANLERLRLAADQKNAGNPAAIASVDRSSFSKEIATSIHDEVALVAILGNLTDDEVAYFESIYRARVAVAQAAVDRDKKLAGLIAHLPGEDRTPLQTKNKADQAALTQAQKDLQTLLDAAGLSAPTREQQAQQDHIAALQAQARPGDQLSADRTAIDVARYQKSIATKPAERSQAQKALNDALYQYQQDQASLAEAIVQSKVFPGDELGAARAQITVAKDALHAAVPGTQAYYNAVKAVHDAEYQYAQTKVTLAEAQAQADVYPGAQMQAAQVQITIARDHLNAATKGSAAYYTAVGQLKQAQVAYANAQVQYNATLRDLNSDLTDPFAQARNAFKQAQDQLRSDQAQHAPAEIINSDQVKVLQTEAASQKASFDQKMQYEQTLYGLHQISGSSYMSFLRHQQATLQAQLATMRKGTQGYQQSLDELLQVQQAIQGLNNQAQGQFNIGDIRMPTMYEVKRSIKAQSSGQQYYQQVTTHYDYRRYNFAGLDKNETTRLVRELIGSDATTRTTTSPRKV